MKRFNGIGSLLMILGGFLIVSILFHLLNDPVDRVIYYVGIPGIVSGLVIFWIGFILSK